MTAKCELQPKTYIIVLYILQFLFQCFNQERIPRCASIVKVWLYESITKQSSRRIIQIVALLHKKSGTVLIFLRTLKVTESPLRLEKENIRDILLCCLGNNLAHAQFWWDFLSRENN